MLAGNTGLSEWLKDPSYANINLSRNKIHGEAKNREKFCAFSTLFYCSLCSSFFAGNGSIQTAISESSAYYVAVGNLNAEFSGASFFLYESIRN